MTEWLEAWAAPSTGVSLLLGVQALEGLRLPLQFKCLLQTLTIVISIARDFSELHSLHCQSSEAFHRSSEPFPVRCVGLLPGQVNDEILCSQLGLLKTKIDCLPETNVVGAIPKSKRAKSDQ